MKVAVFGCGQLAGMMASESQGLNITFSFIAEPGEASDCVKDYGSVVLRQSDMSAESLFHALGEPDVITVEREHVPVALLREFQQFCRVHPAPDAIEAVQNRAREKTMLSESGIPVTPFKIISNFDDLKAAASSLGYPLFVKSCEEGYDGKGQWKINNDDELKAIEKQANSLELIAEKAVNFDFEVSIVGARNTQGDVIAYPLAENIHYQGILYSSFAPCNRVSRSLVEKAESYLKTVLDKFDYVGVLSIECFVVGDQLLVNELAPRVHNSGHWTMACSTASQFENHIRAITGKGIEAAAEDRFFAMVNLIGVNDLTHLAPELNAETYLYAKTLREKRKMGHINLSTDSAESTRENAEKAFKQVYGEMLFSEVFE